MSDWFLSVPPSVLEPHYKAEGARVASDLTVFGKTDALLVCCKLNLLTSDGGSRNPAIGQAEAIILLQKQGLLSASWYNKLRDHLLSVGEQKERAYAINRPALLEFMRWIACDSEEKDPTTYNHADASKAFVRSLLTCSEFYGQRELAATLAEEGTIEEKRFQFLPGERRAIMWAGSFANPLDALGRAQLLLGDHFFGKYPKYLEDFKTHFGITFDEFMTCATAIVLLGFLPDSKKETLTNLNGCFEMQAETVFKNIPQMQDAFRVYLSKLSQSPDELGRALGGKQDVDGNKPFNFWPFRNKPLLAFDDKIIVLDQRLFIESYCAGPLFLLSRALKSEQPIQDYGIACQDYAFRLLCRTNDRYVAEKRLSHLIVEPPSNTGRPIGDIAIGVGSTACLLEAKGVWLNDEVLYETDPNEYWNKIMVKYGVSHDPKTKEEKRKGTAQLADLIKGLSAQTLRGTESASFINTAKCFVPILVMQDYLMTARSLTPHYLAIEFNKLMDQGESLPEGGHFTFDGLTIHSLVPLTLFDLEVLEGIEPETPILDLFLEYSKEVSKRGDSFSAFLFNKPTKIKWLASKEQLVKSTAMNLMQTIQNKYFKASTVIDDG